VRRRAARMSRASLPGPRGWSGRGGGSSVYVQAADEWRATTVQACGLWPFAAGTGTPMVGVPIGRDLLSGATLCSDPISWFQRAHLISNPSMFVLALPGLGKSTLVRRMALGLTGYREAADPLVKTLTGLLGRGRIGEMFSAETTTPMRRDRPVAFDISSIDDAEVTLQRAALMACWSYGFGAINVANALADAGVEPQRHNFVILDELWRALRGGRGMVDRVDALTRLNRQRGVGTAMISHTMSDLEALSDEDDRMKPRGFVERSGMVVCGGLPESEMSMLTGVVALSRAEQDMLVSWQDPAAWDGDAQEEAAPPGRGNFLVKVGGRPGIPVHVALTDVEQALNDTNKRWHDQSRLSDVNELAAEPEA
jgi:hypothetical protein